jgi:pantoate--beta-alanine ligase
MTANARGPRRGTAAGKGAKKDEPSTMKRLQSAESMRRFAREAREAGRTIGFVPTMGAFHEGHLSLIRKARAQNDVVVVSIFVNPLQFGPHEDFEHYPRDLARDLDRARELGVDAVFIPETAEVYPAGFAVRVSVGPLGERLCGAARPGHFDGVCTVVLKLLGIVQPQRMYLGQKDAQQLILIERMVADLNVDTRVVACPTVREPDGLAMSSRNAYLTPEERAALAPRLYQALRSVQRAILVEHERDATRLRERMRALIEDGAGIEVEYIAFVDPETLADRPVLTGRTLIALAARLGKARLIDNILINVPGGRMAEQLGIEREG